MKLGQTIRRILREEILTKSTDKEFKKYKDSKFHSLREYTFQDIVDNWDELSNHKNHNIKTIKYFVENPDEITELTYDEKGLEDGYHRLIASKILNKKQNPIQVYIDENGFIQTLKEFDSIEFIAKKLNQSPKELLKKYKPFEGIFTDTEFKEELKNTLDYLSGRNHINDNNRFKSMEELIEFIISMTIDTFHYFLIDWNADPHDWKVPQTSKLLKIMYEDYIKENNLFKELYRKKNTLQENNDGFRKKIQNTIDEEGIFFTINFFGGIDNLANKLNTKPIELTKDYFLNKEFSVYDFDIDPGGYNFNFTITQITDDDDFWIITVKILDGEVTMMVDDGKTYDLFGSKIRKKSYWWEIQEEVKDIISDILEPFKSKEVDFQIQHNLR